MKKANFIISCVLALAALAAAAQAAPDMTWTPKTGWQSVPPAQAAAIDKARSLYISGDFGGAQYTLEPIIKAGGPAAEEAGIINAECELGKHELRHAFELFEDFLKDYPASPYVDRALAGEVEIAKGALSGEKVRYLKMKIWTGYGLGEKVVERIVERRPSSDYAREAQMVLALSYFNRDQYIEAETAFRQYLEMFPQGPEAQEAMLGIAKSLLNDARGARYDPLPYYQAKAVLTDFKADYPDSPSIKTADSLIAAVDHNLAEHYMDVGLWYTERRNNNTAACVYFKKVADQYAETSYASAAREKMNALCPAAPSSEVKP